jgi:hypothetical protein
LSRLRRIKPENLTETDVKKCLSLTYRSDGVMSERMRHSIAYPKSIKSKCYIIQNNDKILGWALVYNSKEVHFYIRKSERNKGLGKRLIKEVDKDYNNLICYWHDEMSKSFFEKTNYKIVSHKNYEN